MFPDVVEGWLLNARCGNMWNIASRIQNIITINGDMAKLPAGGRQLLLTFFHHKSDVCVSFALLGFYLRWVNNPFN